MTSKHRGVTHLVRYFGRRQPRIFWPRSERADPSDLGTLLDILGEVVTDSELADLRPLAVALDETMRALPEDETSREREFGTYRALGEKHPYEVAVDRLFARIGEVMASYFPRDAAMWRTDPIREVARMVEDAGGQPKGVTWCPCPL